MDAIRRATKVLLDLPIEQNPKIPFIVAHPFTTSPVTCLQTLEGLKPLNLMVPGDAAEWRAWVADHIDSCTVPMQLYLMVSPNYQTGFLMLAEPYLSAKDLPAMVRTVWQNTEDVNAGTNISRSDFVRLFKECDKEAIMGKEEIERYNALPDLVTIYRGVASGKAKSAKSLSWTTDRAIAEKFAYQRAPGKTGGKVFTAKVKKSDILAFFDGEDEVIVDPRHLQDITEYQPD